MALVQPCISAIGSGFRSQDNLVLFKFVIISLLTRKVSGSSGGHMVFVAKAVAVSKVVTVIVVVVVAMS